MTPYNHLCALSKETGGHCIEAARYCACASRIEAARFEDRRYSLQTIEYAGRHKEFVRKG
jgi:hypothetical protein